jgi:hypothetical protein
MQPKAVVVWSEVQRHNCCLAVIRGGDRVSIAGTGRTDQIRKVDVLIDGQSEVERRGSRLLSATSPVRRAT